MVSNYIDEQTRRKIGNGEYVDFAKLMQKDRIGIEEDQRMEMINTGGMSFWIPIADRETTTINSYGRLEQAFRVYSNIYNYHHPTRGRELIQYNHIIHTAARS